MNLRNLILSAVLLAAPLAAPLAHAEAPRAQVEHALSGYEARIDETHLQALGAFWEQAVGSLALDSKAPPLLRVRALFALSFSKAPSTGELLRGVIARTASSTDGIEILQLKEAVRSLATVEGERALAVIAPMLEHPVPDVREAAATSLQRINSDRTKLLVKARLATETEPFVRSALEQAPSPQPSPRRR